MSAVMFLLALVCFVVAAFGGKVGDFDLLALGLAFVAAGLLLGGGTIGWVRDRVVRND